MLRIRNLLYRNDVLSLHKVACIVSPSLSGNRVISVTEDLLKERHELYSRRKLKRMLSSKHVFDPEVRVDARMDVFVKLEYRKCGKLLLNNAILIYDPNSRSVTYAGWTGRAALQL